MKIGVSLKINVSKIDKSRIFQGKKGKYIDLTCFIDTENVSEYGDNGTISQALTSEERKNGLKLPILGNAKIFYTAGGEQRQKQPARTNKTPPPDDESFDIPF